MGKPTIVFIPDVFRSNDEMQVEDVEVGSSPYDWLKKTAPDGFGMAVEIFLNGEPLPLAQADTRLIEDDMVLVVLRPGGEAFMVYFWQAVIAIAVGLIMQLLFPPPKAKSREGATQQYSLSPGNEMPQLGAPVPVAYGTSLAVPYYGSQPWVQYPVIEYAGAAILQTQGSSDWKTNTMYLGALLVATAGEGSIVDLFISDSVVPPASQSPSWNPGAGLGSWDWGNINWPGIPDAPDSDTNHHDSNSGDARYVKWRRFLPSEHGEVEGTIETEMQKTWGVWHENVSTSAEVSDQLLSNTTPIGAFAVCLPGQQAREIHLDVMFPNGLGSISKTTGDDNPERQGISWTIEQIGDDGYPVVPAVTLTGKVEWNIDTPNTVRRTIRIPVAAGRYRISCSSTNATHEETSRVRREIRWAGLKAVLVPTTRKVYGATTLIAIRIQASEGISAGAAGRVKLRFTRHISSVVAPGNTASGNPADVALDILMNTDYGAGRPTREVHMDSWTAMHSKWESLPGFNFVFTAPLTVLEAMQQAVQVEQARIVPRGPEVAVIDASVQPVRTQMYSSHNIVRGSLTATWAWHSIDDPEGVQVEYLDAVNGTPMSVICPLGTEDALTTTYRLPGCTNRAQAYRYALHSWRQSKYIRQNVTFSTEMEGLIPAVGERIAISTKMITKAQDVQVYSLNPGTSTIVLTAPFDPANASAMVIRDKTGLALGPFAITPVDATSFTVTGLDFTQLGNPEMEEPPTVALGLATAMVKDYVVTSTVPQGMYSVQVNAVNYDERAYSSTGDWIIAAAALTDWVIANNGAALSLDTVIPWEP
jgi:hypothetical protein